MNFDIKTEQLSDDAYVISLAGEVDLYTAPEFKQQLLEVIGQGGKQVIVDFTNTTFIDSTTLGVLVGGVKRLRTNDGQLSLVCSDRNITKIFEITGLDRVFAIYATRDEAISQARRRLPTFVPVALRNASSHRRACSPSRSSRRAAAPSAASRAGDPSNGKQLFNAERARRATRSPTRSRRARSARTSTTRSPPTSSRASRSRRWPDIVRGQIAYPRGADAGEPRSAARTPTTSRSTSRSARATRTAASPRCDAAQPAPTTATSGDDRHDRPRGGGSATPAGKTGLRARPAAAAATR